MAKDGNYKLKLLRDFIDVLIDDNDISDIANTKGIDTSVAEDLADYSVTKCKKAVSFLYSDLDSLVKLCSDVMNLCETTNFRSVKLSDKASSLSNLCDSVIEKCERVISGDYNVSFFDVAKKRVFGKTLIYKHEGRFYFAKDSVFGSSEGKVPYPNAEKAKKRMEEEGYLRFNDDGTATVTKLYRVPIDYSPSLILAMVHGYSISSANSRLDF